MPDATCAQPDEAAEVLRCLHESLREPGLATALLLVVSGRRRGDGDDFAERLAPGGSGENGKG